MDIEELAFKDRKILANLNAVDLLNIIEFLQDDRRQCLEELSKTHNQSVEIQKKNQELKSQLEAANEKIFLLRVSKPMLNYKKAQQKEFIKYLEDEKDRLSGTCDIICVSKFDEADDNLQEYKRIIGYSEDE